MQYTLFSDGGSRQNPGPAGYGFVVYDQDNLRIGEGKKYLGHTTNNQAEYQGLIGGLEWIQKDGKATKLECFLDSQLIVKQMKGEYKVKHPGMKKCYEQVKLIMYALNIPVIFTHIPRAQNAEADALANEAMDAGV
jgi:ribonuclease HI